MSRLLYWLYERTEGFRAVIAVLGLALAFLALIGHWRAAALITAFLLLYMAIELGWGGGSMFDHCRQGKRPAPNGRRRPF